MIGEHLRTEGGVHTHFIELGGGSPIVVLHGFSGSTETMAPLTDQLVDRHRVLSLDLVGHGFSEKPTDVDRYSMDVAVGQVTGLIADRGEGPVHLIGYSMGGRVALAAALAAPERVRSLTVIGGTPGISDPAARRARIAADEALADRIEENGVEWFADHWMEQPFFITQRRLGAGHLATAREQRLTNAPHALANSLRGMGTGAQPSLWHRLTDLAMPLMYLVGEDDTKFRAVGEQVVAAVHEGLLAVVPGAGHAVHIEALPTTAEAILHFIER
jgi:2-succinyl-6-hydroxy-2,4-cyclohexadiene-1-carboxylate synthase